MKALIERYRLAPRKASLCDDFDWNAYDDSELVRFCFDGGGGSQKTSNEPWDKQRPYLEKSFQHFEDLFNKGPREYFPGGVTGFAGETEEALDETAGRARRGSDLREAGKAHQSRVLGGDFLDPSTNPVYAGMMENARAGAWRDTATMAGRSGRGPGSAGMTEDFGRGFSDRAMPFLAGEYRAGMGDMNRAAELAPAMARADYDDPRELARVGAVRQEQAGRELDDRRLEHDFDENEESRLAREFGGGVQGNYGGDRTSSGSPGFFDWASLGSATAGK